MSLVYYNDSNFDFLCKAMFQSETSVMTVALVLFL